MGLEEEKKKLLIIDELVGLFAGGRRHYLLMLRDDVIALATRAFELGEITEREKVSGQEHGRCPFGLEYPLQDVKVCRELDCKHYKRKYSERPERCLWTGWSKDETTIVKFDEKEEKPKKEEQPIDFRLSPIEETEVEPALVEELAENPITELQKPTEKLTEDEYDGFVMLYCESGAHKAGIISHGKKNIEPGWAEYTCLECKKVTPMLINKAEEESPFQE